MVFAKLYAGHALADENIEDDHCYQCFRNIVDLLNGYS